MWSEVSLLSHFKAVFEVENSKDLMVGCYYYKNEWNIRLTKLVETSVHRLGGDSSVHRVAGVFFLLQNVCKLKLFCCDINKILVESNLAILSRSVKIVIPFEQ